MNVEIIFFVFYDLGSLAVLSFAINRASCKKEYKKLYLSLVWPFDFYLNLAHHTVAGYKNNGRIHQNNTAYFK